MYPLIHLLQHHSLLSTTPIIVLEFLFLFHPAKLMLSPSPPVRICLSRFLCLYHFAHGDLIISEEISLLVSLFGAGAL